MGAFVLSCQDQSSKFKVSQRNSICKSGATIFYVLRAARQQPFSQNNACLSSGKTDGNHALKLFFFCLNVFKVACKYLSFSRTVPDDHLLHGVSQATKVYYNYTGSSPCLNTSQTATGSLGFLGWFYQVCRDVAVLHLIHHEVNVQPLICRPAQRWWCPCARMAFRTCLSPRSGTSRPSLMTATPGLAPGPELTGPERFTEGRTSPLTATSSSGKLVLSYSVENT